MKVEIPNFTNTEDCECHSGGGIIVLPPCATVDRNALRGAFEPFRQGLEAVHFADAGLQRFSPDAFAHVGAFELLA